MSNNSINIYFKQRPLLLSNLILVDGKPIYGLYILARNVPGALAEISSILAKYNINIVAINFTPSIEEKEEVLLFIAADFKNSDIGPNDIVKELLKLDKVIMADPVKPRLRWLVDERHFPIVDLTGKRRIVLSQENIWFFVVGIRELLGSAGAALLYRQGLIIGEEVAEKYIDSGINTLKEGLESLFIGGLVLGRYRGEVISISLEEKLIKIRLYNNWECETASKFGIKGPASYFERGVLAGLVKGYVGKDVKTEEVRCIASGDPYCEFNIHV